MQVWIGVKLACDEGVEFPLSRREDKSQTVDDGIRGVGLGRVRCVSGRGALAKSECKIEVDLFVIVQAQEYVRKSTSSRGFWILDDALEDLRLREAAVRIAYRDIFHKVIIVALFAHYVPSRWQCVGNYCVKNVIIRGTDLDAVNGD